MIEFLQIDFPALLAATLAAIVCGLLGNLLVLRRQSLMGDAISHAVLPGIVLSFLLTGGLHATSVIIGATVSATFAALLIEGIRRLGAIEPGASMGVVFTLMFAIGIVLVSAGDSQNVHLEPEHVLFGQLENIIWFNAGGWEDLFSLAALSGLPTEVLLLVGVLVMTLVFLTLFHKELQVTSFDPAFASAVGIPALVFHLLLMIMVAVATIAAFTAVGSILVIGLLVCPAATARLLTDNYKIQMLLSALLAALASITGYLLGSLLPLYLGWSFSLSASGMITVVAGLLFGGVALWRARDQRTETDALSLDSADI